MPPRTPRPSANAKANAKQDASERTRRRIMQSAEFLFAEHGYEGTSLRGIMADAEVSISAINYHFGNKEGLLRAIFETKTETISQLRLDWIRSAADADAVPDLDELLRGFFLPSFYNSLRRERRPNHFMRLVGRIGSDRSEIAREMMRQFFDGFQKVFVEALKRALPECSEDDIYWRLHCLLCILTHTINNPRRIYELSDGRCDFEQVDRAFEHLLPFMTAGLRAPPPRPIPDQDVLADSAAVRKHRGKRSPPGVSHTPTPRARRERTARLRKQN